ncbi:outer membrane OprD family porin [Trinickia symbiotica]|uniref:Outer membrane porin, OprD family n=1 Tax=Trinickia symbiotica TaxID=863227 RepID=A0A2N7X0C7_9BURK|nr:OprD family outer membrane porin [Trinickia symbiotica]PMS35032.1 outer membrane porin, OprD family [Trinickia symbiotica]PPK43530.1 outer membrane OprD family porin [Trinickia symbiotica]
MKRDTSSLAASKRLFALTLTLPVVAGTGHVHADERPAPGGTAPLPASAPATSAAAASSSPPAPAPADVANIDVIQVPPVAASPSSTSQRNSKGLIGDSHFDLEFRNYTDYFHDNDGAHRHAWVDSVQARFQSGLTKGLIGFGFDASLFGALKLDGGNGAGNMVFVGKHGGGSNRLAWAYPGTYDVKARISDTVFKYGLHNVSNPFLDPHDNRALPPAFLGASMLSREIVPLTLQAGSFTKVDARGHTNLMRLSTSYGGIGFKRISYAGGTWDYFSSGSASLFADQADDVWRQYYASIQHSIGRVDTIKLTGSANLYSTHDTGAARQGTIDNNAYSLALSAQHGPHALLVGYQKIVGDQFFDYVNETAGNYLTNSMDVDYNAPHEQSLQLRYTFDGNYAGVPGFSAMVWAQQGWGADASSTANRYGPGGPAFSSVYFKNGQPVHGRHHEFGFIPSYVLQSGRLKNTKVTVLAMWHVGSAYYSDPTSQVYRLVVTVPVNVF